MEINDTSVIKCFRLFGLDEYTGYKEAADRIKSVFVFIKWYTEKYEDNLSKFNDDLRLYFAYLHNNDISSRQTLEERFFELEETRNRAFELAKEDMKYIHSSISQNPDEIIYTMKIVGKYLVKYKAYVKGFTERMQEKRIIEDSLSKVGVKASTKNRSENKLTKKDIAGIASILVALSMVVTAKLSYDHEYDTALENTKAYIDCAEVAVSNAYEMGFYSEDEIEKRKLDQSLEYVSTDDNVTYDLSKLSHIWTPGTDPESLTDLLLIVDAINNNTGDQWDYHHILHMIIEKCVANTYPEKDYYEQRRLTWDIYKAAVDFNVNVFTRYQTYSKINDEKDYFDKYMRGYNSGVYYRLNGEMIDTVEDNKLVYADQFIYAGEHLNNKKN